MFIDIAFPGNNEEEFLKVLSKLETRAVCFAYRKEDFSKKDFSKLKNNSIKIYKALFLENSEINKAKQLRDKLKPDLVISNSVARTAFSKNVDVVFELENQEKDYLRYINSGLDSAKAVLALKYDILIGISFSLVLNSQNSKIHRIISRMMQNVMLCRKKKINVVIASFARKPFELRAYHELFSFGFTLKTESRQLKQSLKNNLYERIMFNKGINEGKIIEKGVEILSQEEINEILKKSKHKKMN
ncbi:MAG: RNase P subunit p30 family protein [Candidatus Woesearchaeota archaeon]